MAGTIILQTPTFILRYHPLERIVHHECLQRITGQDLKTLLNAGYELLRKNQATKWLSDDRKNTVLSADDQAWAQTDWFPRVSMAGWKYWAIVNPEKTVGQMQMKRNVQTFAMGGVTAATFSAPDEAFAWLKDVNAPKRAAG